VSFFQIPHVSGSIGCWCLITFFFPFPSAVTPPQPQVSKKPGVTSERSPAMAGQGCTPLDLTVLSNLENTRIELPKCMWPTPVGKSPLLFKIYFIRPKASQRSPLVLFPMLLEYWEGTLPLLSLASHKSQFINFRNFASQQFNKIITKM